MKTIVRGSTSPGRASDSQEKALMTKRGRRSLPESHYQALVRRYLSRKHGCVAVRELRFGGPKFDVVGFSPDTEEFFIVECKRTSRPVGIGQTFGQILAYKAMIFDAGETFLTAFERAISKAGLTREPFWIYAARFVEAGKIPVRFYVALREALTPAPLETPIALDPIFLRGLGIYAVDASLPSRPPSERQVFLHPSFLKDFESEGTGGPFTKLWQRASNALRSADRIFIVGYSLPEADSAALTLFLTDCDPKKVEVVNPNKQTTMRLSRLFARGVGTHWLVRPAISFQDWLATEETCTYTPHAEKPSPRSH